MVSYSVVPEQRLAIPSLTAAPDRGAGSARLSCHALFLNVPNECIHTLTHTRRQTQDRPTCPHVQAQGANRG